MFDMSLEDKAKKNKCEAFYETKHKERRRKQVERNSTHITFENKEHEKVHSVKFNDHKSLRVWNSISFWFHLHFSLLLIEHNEFELMWSSEKTAKIHSS